MPSVSVDPVPQTSQPSSRTRAGRDGTAAQNDNFAMFVDNDAPSQGPAPGPDSPTPPSTDRNSAAATSRQNAHTPAPSRSTDTASAASTQDEVPKDDSEQTTADEATIPTVVFVGLQAAASPPADPVIESGGTTPVANPPASLPGGTAALALARVAQDTEAQDTQPKDALANGAPAQTTPQASKDQPVQNAADQPAADAPRVPAIADPDQAIANAALETTTELTTRIPTEASAVEADAKLQATVAATEAPATEHGRLIASTSAQPLLTPLKLSSSAGTQCSSPIEGQELKLSGPDGKAPDSRQPDARQSGVQSANDPGNAPAQPQIGDKQAAAHSQAGTDNAVLTEMTPGALPAHTQLQVSANAQLTATPANPNVAVPVAALAVEIATNVQIGRSRFEIRLDPPELGRIEVKLDVDRQGHVTSHIIVEKAATLDLLRRDAPQLERALQDAGLKTSNDGLQFSLRDQQSQTGRNDHNENGRNAHRLTITEEETVPRETAGRSYGRMLSPSGGIDMRV